MSDPIDPKHYNQLAIQPRDYITKNNLGYNEGNIVKYISRWRLKGGLNDLKKAQNYINYLIKLVEEHQQKKTQPKKEKSTWPQWLIDESINLSKTPIRFGRRPNWKIDEMLKDLEPGAVREIVGRKAWDEWNKKKKKKPGNVVDFKKDPKK